MDSNTLISQTLSTLKCVTTERVRFKLPLTAKEVEAVMVQAYNNIVTQRGGTPTDEASTKANIQSIARWLTDAKLRPSLLLRGGVGNGKTTTAKSIVATFEALRLLAVQKLRNDRWQMTAEQDAVYTALSKLPALRIVSAVDAVALAKDEDAFKQMRNSLILIIDDLGTEPATAKVYGTEQTPIAEIINHRYEVMLTTIITTNLNDDAIAKRYGERTIDRLREMCERLTFTGASYRTKR